MIATLKFLHLASMLCWCAALVALPLLFSLYGGAWRSNHGTEKLQARYAEFRLITHYGYVAFATPAAVIAIVAGTGLIFAADVFDLWFVAKLALVSGMALVHAWIGHLVVVSAEERSIQRLPSPLIALFIVIPLIAGVLWLVLAKPDLSGLTEWMPEFMLKPRNDL
ncbi:CopD family protein [Paracoccus sp. (in: a-proteobacteria)]|uniref:CopD family protein n=1 Tax=Paracoccus sp. TaxID=267 RepID=UPI00396C75B5